MMNRETRKDGFYGNKFQTVHKPYQSRVMMAINFPIKSHLDKERDRGDMTRHASLLLKNPLSHARQFVK